jgi:hypothetical protein
MGEASHLITSILQPLKGHALIEISYRSICMPEAAKGSPLGPISQLGHMTSVQSPRFARCSNTLKRNQT